MTRKICVVTGSRAEYGLLRWVMSGIQDATNLELQLIVTGSHLMSGFGDTYREIEQDGFEIHQKVDLGLRGDTAKDVTTAMGTGMSGFAQALDTLRPDLMVVLGDRYEILCAVIAALVARIPVAHIHGGEVTTGAIDDSIRHAITKMSHLHFVAAEDYRKRVIQLGESPDRVFIVGAPGLDSVERIQLLSREELASDLGLDTTSPLLVVTFHPVTLAGVPSQVQVDELLAALDECRRYQVLFTMPNADPDGMSIWRSVAKFVERHPNAKAVSSLGQRRYFSCLKHADAVVGNSSSGIIEAPSLGTYTVNIGERQDGRLRAPSVIDCAPERSAIKSALERVRKMREEHPEAHVDSPYGAPGASNKIIDVLESVTLPGLEIKRFHDMNLGE